MRCAAWPSPAAPASLALLAALGQDAGDGAPDGDGVSGHAPVAPLKHCMGSTHVLMKTMTL